MLLCCGTRTRSTKHASITSLGHMRLTCSALFLPGVASDKDHQLLLTKDCPCNDRAGGQTSLSCSYVAHQRKQAAGPPFWLCENAGQQSPSIPGRAGGASNVAQHPRWNNLGSAATEQCLRSCTEMHAQAIRYNIQATCAERDGCTAKPNPSRYTRHSTKNTPASLLKASGGKLPNEGLATPGSGQASTSPTTTSQAQPRECTCQTSKLQASQMRLTP